MADTGSESLWWNPAAIASSPNEMYVGANSVLTSSTVTNSGSFSSGPASPGPITGAGKAYDPVLFGVIPNSAGSFRINDRFAIGLSFAAPYDFTSQYDANSFTRYNSLKARLTTLDAQLTGAMKVTDWLDLGLGFNTEYTSANLAQAYLPVGGERRQPRPEGFPATTTASPWAGGCTRVTSGRSAPATSPPSPTRWTGGWSWR